MSTSKVQILLSTYNGEKYLTEQLESLLDQDYSNFEIFIRDDGSTDKTKDILKGYERLAKVRIIYGTNIGAVKSFFKLLELSDPNAQFFCFCDQDDFWFPDKISRAISFITELSSEIPGLYCSNQTLTDEKLNRTGFTDLVRRNVSFNNAVIQNIAVGCTILINNRTRYLVLENIPENAVMHDWWMYLVVSAFGEVVFDYDSRIFYRQHGDNIMGYKKNILEKWKNRIIRFLKNNVQVLAKKQAEEFFSIYKNGLQTSKYRIMEKFFVKKNIIQRLIYSLKPGICMQSRIDDIIMRIILLSGKI